MTSGLTASISRALERRAFSGAEARRLDARVSPPNAWQCDGRFLTQTLTTPTSMFEGSGAGVRSYVLAVRAPVRGMAFEKRCK